MNARCIVRILGIAFWWCSLSLAQGPLDPETFRQFQKIQKGMLDAQDEWNKAKKLGFSEVPKEPRPSLDPSTLTVGSRGYLEQWEYSIVDILGPKEALIAIRNPSIPALWLTNYSTKDLADGDKVRLIGTIEVTGTKSYESVAGSTETVRTIQFVSAERLKEIQAAEAKAIEEFLTREWTDATGTHKTLGKFIDFKDGKVSIERKPDGKVLSVQMTKLSKDDQQWIRTELKRRKFAETKKSTEPKR